VKNGTTPLLSIIIPVYNRQEGVNHLLTVLTKSISESSFEKEVEIIVIDDCSEQKLILSDFPLDISLKRNTQNQGAPLSRQRGLE
jgi:glycosyltransferase involved in cell wall biosynthesis